MTPIRHYTLNHLVELLEHDDSDAAFPNLRKTRSFAFLSVLAQSESLQGQVGAVRIHGATLLEHFMTAQSESPACKLLEHFPELAANASEGRPPLLLQAIAYDMPLTVASLLARGADPMERASGGQSALAVAVASRIPWAILQFIHTDDPRAPYNSAMTLLERFEGASESRLSRSWRDPQNDPLLHQARSALAARAQALDISDSIQPPPNPRGPARSL